MRQWVMSPPIRLRLLRAAQSELVRPVLQVVQHLLGRTGLRAEEGHGDTVTVIQRCGSTANFNFRPTLSDDRLQCNAARQVELKRSRAVNRSVRRPRIQADGHDVYSILYALAAVA